MGRCTPFLFSVLLQFYCSIAVGNLSDASNCERMIETLDIIKNSFQVQYAPAKWKKNYSGWELDSEIEKAKDRVRSSENMNVKEFQRIVRDFFKSTQDYHVGVSFYSTEAAVLPFRVKGAKGKYFITQIDRKKLSSVVFPFQVGDELTMFAGRPTHEVVTEFKEQEVGNASEETDFSMAELFLTVRIGALGHYVPKGPVTVTVKTAKTQQSSSFQLIWNYLPEKITSKAIHFEDNFEKVFCKKMVSPLYQTLLCCDQDPDDRETLGARQSFIPDLGKKWWESDAKNPFYAYLYETSDRRLVGYVRIPHYNGDENDAEEFSKIIKFLEDRSDALVIDQVNNPGGSVFYLYALASMLTEQPLFAPRHKMTITQKEVMSAVSCIPIFENIKSDEDAIKVLGKTLDGNSVTYQMAQFFLNYFRFVVDEWNAGRVLTKPFYLFGVDHINPHPESKYTKPILLLTNGMDFSGGDFFPAILQDNKRVTILGSRTAGAGGFVVGGSFPNQFGIASYNYTASIAERVDSNPIENLGVEPDLPYQITEADLQEGYAEYAQTIRDAVSALIE